MEISYELKSEDFIQFGKENLQARKDFSPAVIIFFITYVLFILADIIYVFISDLVGGKGTSLLANIAIRTVLTFVSIALVWGIVKLITRFMAKKVSKAQENGLICEHKIVLSENELIEITDVNLSRYSMESCRGNKGT